MIKTTLTAKDIRKELKAAFPNIKFSVRSEKLQGYVSSVDVEWFDGPTLFNVQDLLAKYQLGHMVHMEDTYDIDCYNPDINQVFYVSTQRIMSQQAKEIICKEVSDPSDSKIVYQAFCKKAF